MLQKNGLIRSCSQSNRTSRRDWIRIPIVKVTIELRKGITLSQDFTTPTINSNFRIQS